MPIVRTEARRLYKCDCCGLLDVWSDNWAWFGSYRQLDDFGMKGVADVMTICSAECRIKLIAENRLPQEGIDDNGNVVEEKDESSPFRKRRTPSRARASLGER